MYSLPRSFTPHPLLKRAAPSPATIRPSVSTQTTTQAHTPPKMTRQKEITTPTSTRVSRSSTTPKPSTHSNVDVTSTTTTSTTTNTRMYRQAYPLPPTSPSSFSTNISSSSSSSKHFVVKIHPIPQLVMPQYLHSQCNSSKRSSSYIYPRLSVEKNKIHRFSGNSLIFCTSGATKGSISLCEK